MKNLGLLSALALSASLIAPAAMAKGSAQPTVKTPARGGVVHQLRAPQASTGEGVAPAPSTKARAKSKVAGTKAKRPAKRAKVTHTRAKKARGGRSQAKRHMGSRSKKSVAKGSPAQMKKGGRKTSKKTA